VTEVRSGPGRGHWGAKFFDDVFWQFAEDVYTDPQTGNEIEMVVATTAARSGWSCLDLACGRGRHAIALAKSGLSVAGVDISAASISHARREAARQGSDARFTVADLREYEIGPASWNLIMLLQNTFGYFDDLENMALIRRIYHGLRPGGACYIDALNFDYVRDNFEAATVYERSGKRFVMEQSYDYVSAVLRQTLRLDAPGAPPARTSTLRMYGTAEIVSLLRLAGFVRVQAYGSHETNRAAQRTDRYVQIVGWVP
jgi:D-alanine-D-alanine ligase